MPVLHVVEQGSRLRLSDGQLWVESADDERLFSLPIRRVRRVHLHGRVEITAAALAQLLDQGTNVYFFSTRGRLRGVAAALTTGSAKRLRQQLDLDPWARLLHARAIVDAKIRSQAAYLERRLRARRRGDRPTDLIEETIQELGRIRRRLHRQNSLNRVRGAEGAATARYFRALRLDLAPFGFNRRLRRPPADPVNAALSYGYALLKSVAHAALVPTGLHLELGLLHAESRRNPALVLDLMEEFRTAAVDMPVTRLFLQGRLTPGHTEKRENGGVWLNTAGKKVLIKAFEAQLGKSYEHPALQEAGTLEELLQAQALRLAKAATQGSPYRPFYLRKPR